MTKAKLVIMRHGETHHNIQGLMTGQADVPLTELGENQAREAGALIAHIRFDKAYSSDLQRAFNTAALALKSAGQSSQIEKCHGIAELDVGDFTGLNYRNDPKVLNFKREFDTVFPNGESQKQLLERVQKFFDSEVMPRLLKGENVLVVAHAGVLRAFDVVLGVDELPKEGMMAKKKSLPNATPTVYEYEDGVMAGFALLENPKTPVPPVMWKR